LKPEIDLIIFNTDHNEGEKKLRFSPEEAEDDQHSQAGHFG
jgi:hypothetical protein